MGISIFYIMRRTSFGVKLGDLWKGMYPERLTAVRNDAYSEDEDIFECREFPFEYAWWHVPAGLTLKRELIPRRT